MSDTFRDLLAFLRRLDEAKIAYTLRHSRDDAIMVKINVPGERWEVDFVDYGDEVQVEIEKFKSNGEIHDETALEDLFAICSDEEPSINETVNHHDAVARK